MPPRIRLWLARLAAPAALLLAATVVVLLVQNALDTGGGASRTTATTSTTPARQPTPPRPGKKAKTPVKREFYRVQAGDTLETIAEQYGTTVEELLMLNPAVDPVSLTIGQRIRVQ